jgi:hypothetical protein
MQHLAVPGSVRREWRRSHPRAHLLPARRRFLERLPFCAGCALSCSRSLVFEWICALPCPAVPLPAVSVGHALILLPAGYGAVAAWWQSGQSVCLFRYTRWRAQKGVRTVAPLTPVVVWPAFERLLCRAML